MWIMDTEVKVQRIHAARKGKAFSEIKGKTTWGLEKQ